jgi:hypothetical protein
MSFVNSCSLSKAAKGEIRWHSMKHPESGIKTIELLEMAMG